MKEEGCVPNVTCPAQANVPMRTDICFLVIEAFLFLFLFLFFAIVLFFSRYNTSGKESKGGEGKERKKDNSYLVVHRLGVRPVGICIVSSMPKRFTEISKQLFHCKTKLDCVFTSQVWYFD